MAISRVTAHLSKETLANSDGTTMDEPIAATASSSEAVAQRASDATARSASDRARETRLDGPVAAASMARLSAARVVAGEVWPPARAEAASRFRILQELGGGGAARVFLAVAQGPAGFNKLLVLKQPRDSLLHIKECQAAFLEEARLAARLNHPNIVQTYEVTEEQGIPSIVMEYLEGESLSRIVANCVESLSLAMRLRILLDVLAGLHYVHELRDYDGTSLGLVHRDVSPQNVFVTFEGQVKVLDFGIAKPSRSSIADTDPGLIKGKLHYMSPEQIAKDEIDRRSDLYPVGVMLWEALAGQRMWTGLADGAVLKRVLLGDLPKLRAIRPDVPERLEAICARALSVDRDERYASAADFESDLEAAVERLDLRVSNRAIGKLLAATLADTRAKTKGVVEALLSSTESSREELVPAPQEPGNPLLRGDAASAVVRPVPEGGRRAWARYALLAVVLVALVGLSAIVFPRPRASSPTALESERPPASAEIARPSFQARSMSQKSAELAVPADPAESAASGESAAESPAGADSASAAVTAPDSVTDAAAAGEPLTEAEAVVSVGSAGPAGSVVPVGSAVPVGPAVRAPRKPERPSIVRPRPGSGAPGRAHRFEYVEEL